MGAVLIRGRRQRLLSPSPQHLWVRLRHCTVAGVAVQPARPGDCPCWGAVPVRAVARPVVMERIRPEKIAPTDRKELR